MRQLKDEQALFALGDLVASPGALRALVREMVTRHQHGDWGDLDEEDEQQNVLGLEHHLRLLSAYVLPHTKARIWVLTEADRSITTVLLPEEY